MRALPLILCGVLGGVAGGFLVGILDDDDPQKRTTTTARRERDTGLAARVAALEAQAETWARRKTLASEGGGGVTPDASEEPDARKTPPDSPAERATDRPEAQKPAALVSWLVGQGSFGGSEANRMFGWMSRQKERIPELLAGLKKALAADPKNADLHAALATAYVGQLQFNTPAGAQQGPVWMQADAAYKKAIELDTEHWQARFGRAFGTSFIPVQFGQRPNAIRQFEKLRGIQEGRAPEKGFAQTYAQLGRLYAEAGNVAKARKVLKAGQELFPEDRQIRAQLEVSEKK